MKPLSNLSIAVCFGILGLLLVGCTSNGPNNPASSAPTTTIPPPPPELIAPYSGMPGNRLALSLRWEELDNAECYRVQIATSEDFAADLVNEYDVMENITGVAGLDENSDYYWRVRAKNNGGYGDWSATWSFSTGDGTPPNSIEGSWVLIHAYDYATDFTMNGNPMEKNSFGSLVMSLSWDGKFNVEGEISIHYRYWDRYLSTIFSDSRWVETVDEEGFYVAGDSTVVLPVSVFESAGFYVTDEKHYQITADTLRLHFRCWPYYSGWQDESLCFLRN